jgi:hypothetical protein
MLIVQMVSTCNFWLNICSPKDGVSRNINPQELVAGVKIDYNEHIRAEFGECVQVHEEHDNSMKTRTTGAIATKPTGNVQGGHCFCSLTAGRMLGRQRWTSLPMPTDAIERITALAKASPVGMNFTNVRNEVVCDDIDGDDDDGDSDDDSDYDSDDEESEGDDDNYDDFIAGVDMNNADPPDPPDENVNENQNNDEHDEEDEDVEIDDVDNDEEENETADPANEDENDTEEENETPVVPTKLKKLTDHTGALPPIAESRTRQQAQAAGESLVTEITEKEEGDTVKPVSKKQRKLQRQLQQQLLKSDEGERLRKLKNRLKNEKRRLQIKERKKEANECAEVREEPDECEDLRPDEFGDLRDQLRAGQKPGVCCPHDSCSSKDLTPELEATALTQCNLKRGPKEFGSEGLIALGKEVEQLCTRKVSKPVDGNDLTREQKRASPRYLMFLTKKRCGRIKARGCADGRKQRETTSKEEASAPTVATKAVMLSATIDAMEERDIATADIPGAFMQADIDEVVHVKFEGEIAEMLVKLDPKLCRKYIKDENGKSVLCVELLKALCGTLKAALLFWKLLWTKLVAWGCKINPCDWCVANKMINGKQCTILWHVDDLKTSHVDPEVNTEIIKLINDEFGKEAPITVTRGKTYDYLDMTLDCTEKVKVKIKMINYVEKMLADLPEEMDGEAPTPAANHLFAVDDDCPKVDERKAQFFHTHTAKSLFPCKRARPDLQTAVAFLCTRVKDCNEDDHKKLKRML